MKFNKVYIELTNVCGLKCNFCPSLSERSTTIDLKSFESILIQLKPFTKELYLHLFGDPLTLSNLEKYLDIANRYKYKINITTSGFYLGKFNLDLFLNSAIKQINFSLNSFNKNSSKKTLLEYLTPMFELCDLKLKNKVHSFINFRLWNLDISNSENSFNEDVLELLSNKFNIDLSKCDYKNRIRLENQILLDFDEYFQWPSLESNHFSHSYCQGMDTHFGILSDGTVVPCCLDGYGIVNLGNVYETSLNDILNSRKVNKIINDFKRGICSEELCQKCTYKDRFKKY
jgi:radical SAM protein with 4Fe4S-binding SPASM domain